MDNGGGSSEAAAQPLEWKFSQVFGERTAGEEVQEGTIFIFALSDSAYGSTFIYFLFFITKLWICLERSMICNLDLIVRTGVIVIIYMRLHY